MNEFGGGFDGGVERTIYQVYAQEGENFESIRMVRRSLDNNCSSIRQYTFAELAARFASVVNKPLRNSSATSAKLHQALQPSLSEMFFTQKLILVEGLEDVAYIQAWMVLTGRWDSFRRCGAHIVPVNGKSELIRPVIIALGLEIPTLAIIDADGDKLMKTDATGVKVDNPSVRLDHERDNRALVRLLGGDEDNLFPSGVIWGDNLVMWPSDLADTAKREFIVSLGPQGEAQLEAVENKARADAGNAGDLGKNSIYIGYFLERLNKANGQSPSLDRLCEKILQFSAASTTAL
jgi:hypothetical protein